MRKKEKKESMSRNQAFLMKLALFICLLFIVACGQKAGEVKKDAFAENAEQHLPIVINFLYPHAPNAKPEITEKKVLYTDDSLHIASFVMKYQNALGVASENTFVYFWGLSKDASYYYLLTPQRHLYDEMMSLYKETLNEPRYQNTDSITRKWMLHGMATTCCQLNNGGQLKE